jgi:hypothetical protein
MVLLVGINFTTSLVHTIILTAKVSYISDSIGNTKLSCYFPFVIVASDAIIDHKFRYH